jgi:hypothetical protein
MGVQSTQGLNFRLVANDVALDLFKDEEIKISDNVTGLFDLGELPSDFTRTITLPGTKKNNAFFEHVYDISVTNPFLFATNQKVDAYFDFGGIYVASGYLQLNKVNVLANKFIDSYEVNIFGSLSSFAREINRATLNDLTTLTQYNHTASWTEISGSWDGELFGGDIVYPMADYGKGINYNFAPNSFGINTASGSMGVHDFKPAIRVKKVFDAIFEEYGYTYESTFLDSGVWDDIYLLCDRNLRYPVYDGVDLEGFGQFKATPVSGSDTDITLTNGIYFHLSYDNLESNPQGSYVGGSYTLSGRQQSYIRGAIGLNVNVSGSSGVPQFTLQAYRTTGTPGQVDAKALTNINKFFRETDSQNNSTGERDYELEEEFNMLLTTGSYEFRLKYDNYNGSNFTVVLNPESNTEGYLEVNEVVASADYRIMQIAPNLPYGENGIKQLDFIRGLQKKFNLVIYPSKTKNRHFIVDTFNNWYKKGQVKSFDNFINLDKKIQVEPANNLAVREVNFGDLLGKDFLAQQFEKEANRDFGTINYVDNQNFFSQGKLDVKTTFSASPLRYLPGTGVTGSALTSGFPQIVAFANSTFLVCNANAQTVYDANDDGLTTGNILYVDQYLTTPVTGYSYATDPTGDIYEIDSSTGEVGLNIGPCDSPS